MRDDRHTPGESYGAHVGPIKVKPGTTKVPPSLTVSFELPLLPKLVAHLTSMVARGLDVELTIEAKQLELPLENGIAAVEREVAREVARQINEGALGPDVTASYSRG